MDPEDPFTPLPTADSQQPTSSNGGDQPIEGGLGLSSDNADYLINLSNGGGVEAKMEVDDPAYGLNAGDVGSQGAAQPRANIEIKGTDGTCYHEVAVPSGHSDSDLRSWVTYSYQQSLMVFPFELDSYQEEALKVVERGHSTIVAAPAAAGKSIALKYLVAKATQERFRLIYISTYEKLCLRKYRELCDDFASVGYVSPADNVAIEPLDSCVLMMTLATLRRLFLSKSTILDGISWIVFDEAHTIGDKGTGHLYEDTMMLMWGHGSNDGRPLYKLLILTEPMSNIRQLAKWVADRQKEPCHYIGPDATRLVPQQRFVYSTTAADGLTLAVNSEGVFVGAKFANAMEKHRMAVERRELAHQGSQNGAAPAIQPSIKEEPLFAHVVNMLRTLRERQKLPAIVYCANEMVCEEVASALSRVDFLNETEKARVAKIYDAVVDQLESADKQLSPVAGYKHCLQRGIGVHHSGMLPLLNELTETLHDKGYVRALITVESFAKETKLSARSVLITFSRRLDGHSYRPLTSDEYSLMAGRAGRRGRDDRGWVVLLLDHEMGVLEAEQLMTGTPPTLKSQLSMNASFAARMIITLAEPVDVFKKTFLHYCADTDQEKLQKDIDALEEKRNGMFIELEQEMDAYHEQLQLVEGLSEQIRGRLLVHEQVVPFLSDGVGRLLHIVHQKNDYGWGALVFFQQRPQTDNPLSTDRVCIIDVAVRVASGCVPSTNLGNIDLALVRPPPAGDEGVIAVVPFTYECIRAVSTIRLKLPEHMDDPDGKRLLQKILKQTIEQRLDGEVPELNPNEDMAVKDKELKRLGKRLDEEKAKLKAKLARADSTNSSFKESYAKYLEKVAVGKEVDALKAEKERREGLELANRYDAYKQLFTNNRSNYYMHRDGSLNANNLSIVLSFSVPGAAILTELLLDGAFKDLAPSAVAALLSCFVPMKERAGWVKLTPEMETSLKKLQAKAKEFAQAAHSLGIDLGPPEKYAANSFPGHLMDVIRKWCDGAPLGGLSTDVLEGAVVRCLRGVNGLLLEMIEAAQMIPNANETLMKETRKKLRGGIPFAKSLYLR